MRKTKEDIKRDKIISDVKKSEFSDVLGRLTTMRDHTFALVKGKHLIITINDNLNITLKEDGTWRLN